MQLLPSIPGGHLQNYHYLVYLYLICYCSSKTNDFLREKLKANLIIIRHISPVTAVQYSAVEYACTGEHAEEARLRREVLPLELLVALEVLAEHGIELPRPLRLLDDLHRCQRTQIT